MDDINLDIIFQFYNHEEITSIEACTTADCLEQEAQDNRAIGIDPQERGEAREEGACA